MSEHKGLWVRLNGNVVMARVDGTLAGYVEHPHAAYAQSRYWDELPCDAIPLVPQSEVDAVKALLGAVASEISYTGDDEGLLQAVRNDRADCNRAGQSLAARHAADDIAKLQAKLVEAQSVPSLPAVDSPEGLRYAADVIEAVAKAASYEGSTEVDEWPFAAHELRADADRLEREQVEKAERDKVIEDMAQVLHSDDERRSGSTYPIAWLESSESNRDAFRSNARAILDRYDITPKP